MIRSICLLLLIVAVPAQAKHPSSFSSAKKALYNKIYTAADMKQSFYCGCDYDYVERKDKKGKFRNEPEFTSCGFEPRKSQSRASRIEAEHIMPAHHFGQHFSCWRDDNNGDGKPDGRKGCSKDPTFKTMESDLHNLVPAIGEVNGDRSNFQFGMIEGEKRVYGSCDAEVDFKARVFEPKPEVRGDIARVYFYMAGRYKVRLSKQQRQLLEAWAKSDPVSKEETQRNAVIAAYQGNGNPFIEN